MPTLDWIGKKAVLNHHREVPFHLLKEVPELSVGDSNSGNLLVQGDNLLALKALLPYYAGKVKCIYIDPPYNTGNENWVYNDAVNSPEMKAWLGKVVGGEADDLSRHDKWLCMMYPRLSLLREFLRQDGVLFVSIGETEVARLRLLLDEIFGEGNSLGTLVWKRRSSSAMRGMPLSIDHEYVLVFGRSAADTLLYGLSKHESDYRLVGSDGRRYASTDLTVGMGRDERPGQFYDITNPRTGKVYSPNPNRVWRFFPATMAEVIAKDLIIWPDEMPGTTMERPRYKTYFDPETSKPLPVSSWVESPTKNDRDLRENEAEYELSILTAGTTQEGGKLLDAMFGKRVFAYPKPLSLIRSLIRCATRGNDLVLDSFAGSGTTGHAVLDLNSEDGGDRRTILVEAEEDIARQVTIVRMQRAIAGYTTEGEKKQANVTGLGGGMRFVTLGDTLLDEAGSVRPSTPFSALASYVHLLETGVPLGRNPGDPLIGAWDGRAIYLVCKGGAPSPFTAEILASLPAHSGPKVVYAASCHVSDDQLQSERVTFKQIPYDLITD